MSATFEQKIILLQAKLKDISLDIKETVKQGRLISKDPNAESMFRGMFRSLDGLYTKFTSVWEEIMFLYVINDRQSEFPNADDSALMRDVKRYYHECGSIYELSVAPNTSGQHSATMPSLNISSNLPTRSRLPKITLPKFDGNLSGWTVFRDMYLSMVHNELSIPEIEKFHYLIGSLSGSALTLIKAIPMTETNYYQAWDTITKHFDNKRKLASLHISKILEFKPMQGKPSVKSLKDFYLVMSENIQAFNNLGIENAKEFILFELAIRCLDPTTREAFEVKHIETEFPSITELINFVETRYQALTMISENHQDQVIKVISPHPSPNYYQAKPNKLKESYQGKNNTFFVKSPSTPQNEGSSHQVRGPSRNYNHNQALSPLNSCTNHQFNRLPTCLICKELHRISDCPNYQNSKPEERWNLVKKYNICFNCLHPSHQIRECSSKNTCRDCGSRHHSTLHISKSSTKSEEVVPSTPKPPANILASINTSTLSDNNSTVVLGTAIALIQDIKGCYQPIRLVIDSGSQYSFITRQCARRLGLKVSPFSRSIAGVGQAPLIEPQGKTLCYLKSIKLSYSALKTEAVVVPSITSYLPQYQLPLELFTKYQHLDLADPKFNHPGPIDFLLGADLFTEIINQVDDSSLNDKHLLQTIFGYVVMGRFQTDNVTPPSLSLFTSNQDLHSIMSRFWEMEELQKEEQSSESIICEQHFQQTHYRLPSGRYVVRLPFKKDYFKLGPSKDRALKRLYNLESKLSKSNDLRTEYNKFLQEYLDLSHMTKTSHPAQYVIPHQPVYKSDTNKLRVVFDASAKTTLGSLNDHLMVGPKLHKDIQTIILNFRRHKIVFITDIIKMFRQIYLDPADRIYQHIVWRFNQTDNVEEYELNTITYGMAPAPYLALRTLLQLAKDEGSDLPLAASAIVNDCYVDDIVTGAASVSDAIMLKNQLDKLLSRGCFQLSKWASNSPEVIKTSNQEDSNMECVDLSSPPDNNQVKVLGMQWDPVEDVFKYDVQLPPLILTKRAILSTIAHIYDPLGYLSPTIFYAKQILQETWKASLEWDARVPHQIEKSWTNFIEDLHSICSIRIPRFLQLNLETSSYHLLGFCDASQKGFCAVLYLRVENLSETKIFLIKSKTKLAPLKQITIPRLELCAAELLAKLYMSVQDFLIHLPKYTTSFFTDASVVLNWLSTPNHLLKVFISNRVCNILNHTKLEWWKHIKTAENPADCGSRGVLPSNLTNHPLWWTGPPWALLPVEEWPSFYPTLPIEALPELRINPVSLITCKSFLSDFDLWTKRFSKYSRLIRSFAYVIRFMTKPTQRNSGSINSSEYDEANLKIIKILQQYYYPEAFKNQIESNSTLLSLNVFMDDKGLLRVGGRIKKSHLHYDQKHQILLPKRSHFTSLIIHHLHQENFHIGPASLQSILNQKYWIPSARNLIRLCKSKCLTCIRMTKKPQAPFMGNLPSNRFQEVRAFYTCGVDFAGPF